MFAFSVLTFCEFSLFQLQNRAFHSHQGSKIHSNDVYALSAAKLLEILHIQLEVRSRKEKVIAF